MLVTYLCVACLLLACCLLADGRNHLGGGQCGQVASGRVPQPTQRLALPRGRSVMGSEQRDIDSIVEKRMRVSGVIPNSDVFPLSSVWGDMES